MFKSDAATSRHPGGMHTEAKHVAGLDVCRAGAQAVSGFKQGCSLRSPVELLSTGDFILPLTACLVCDLVNPLCASTGRCCRAWTFSLSRPLQDTSAECILDMSTPFKCRDNDCMALPQAHTGPVWGQSLAIALIKPMMRQRNRIQQVSRVAFSAGAETCLEWCQVSVADTGHSLGAPAGRCFRVGTASWGVSL